MLDYIGSVATIRVSDPLMNGRSFPIIKAYVNENKFLLDATDSTTTKQGKWLVRYIKVSSDKITRFADDIAGVQARAVMLANNRETAFIDAGLDTANVWALDPRPEASIRPRCAFADVPRLAERLNLARVPGHPFQLTFGYFVFADMNAGDIKIGTTAPALYSSEHIVLLKDSYGKLIDVSPDVGNLSAIFELSSIPPRKIFIEDPRLDVKAVNAGMFAIHCAREVGFLAGSTWDDPSRLSPENPVELGMLPEEVDKVPENPLGCVVHIFKDGGLRGCEKDKKKLSSYNFLADTRRKMYLDAATVCSREFFVDTCLDAAPHEGRLLTRSKFGKMCFGCYIRLDDSEVKMCGGCGKAVYCSAMCQNWHWKEHRLKCATPEERKARREAAAVARERRAAELARHDELVALQKAEEDAKEAVRKHQAMVARAERAEKEEREYARLQEDKPAVPSDSGQTHRGRNKKKMHVMTVEQKLVHGRWTSEQERQDRQEAATLRKQAAHLEAEARKAQKRVEQMKAKISNALKDQAAAAHAVPARASVGEALAEAVKCVSIE